MVYQKLVTRFVPPQFISYLSLCYLPSFKIPPQYLIPITHLPVISGYQAQIMIPDSEYALCIATVLPLLATSSFLFVSLSLSLLLFRSFSNSLFLRCMYLIGSIIAGSATVTRRPWRR